MCARRKQSVIFKIDRTMNYFLLAETDFFRLINEAGDCNMETAYTAFATQVIELSNGGMDMNLTVIALAYIEIELQHHPVRNLSEEKREIAAYVSKALSFVRKMQKFLATPQVPPLISANNATETTAAEYMRRCWFQVFRYPCVVVSVVEAGSLPMEGPSVGVPPYIE